MFGVSIIAIMKDRRKAQKEIKTEVEASRQPIISKNDIKSRSYGTNVK